MDTKLILRYFLERVEARNRMYIIISCQEKNPEQKILIFHDENWFSKFEEKYFRDQKIFETFSYEKINEKWKFQNFDFFARKIEILKFSFFIDFFIGKMFENFLVSKNIVSTFSTIFFDIENFMFLWIFFYINPKFPQESKNHT